jgi:hypothetical protein
MHKSFSPNDLLSSYEIHRALGVTQKTAWFTDHRIRLAMQSGSFEKAWWPLSVRDLPCRSIIASLRCGAENLNRSLHECK